MGKLGNVKEKLYSKVCNLKDRMALLSRNCPKLQEKLTFFLRINLESHAPGRYHVLGLKLRPY